jgi:HSP20 family protein
MDRLAQEMRSKTTRTSVTTLPVDVYDRGEELVVRAFVPGIQADHLDIQIDEGVLTISGRFPQLYDPEEAQGWTWYSLELRTGDFQRSVALPYKVDLGGIRAQVENGLLQVVLPKAAEAKAHRISIGGETSVQPIEAESTVQQG